MTERTNNHTEKRAPPPEYIYSKFFASHFTFLGIILILSFHISCLSFIPPPFCPQPPPPPPSLLHQGSCGLSETQMNEGPRRASPALPHITYSLSLSLSQSHKRDLPAFVPCRHYLLVVMVTDRRPFFFFFFLSPPSFAADA